MVRPMPNAATLFPLKAFLSGVPSKERGRSKPYAVAIKHRRPFAIAGLGLDISFLQLRVPGTLPFFGPA